MFGLFKMRFCPICGTEAIKVQVGFRDSPYNAETGKFNTKTVEGCPNPECSAFYQTKGFYLSHGPLMLGGVWVWVGRISALTS